MTDSMLPLPGLSLVSGKTVVAKFDGGQLSSNGGILALREVEQRLRVADRFAACIVDPRAPDLITHSAAAATTTLGDTNWFGTVAGAAGSPSPAYPPGVKLTELGRFDSYVGL